jgi:hypothetical protein
MLVHVGVGGDDPPALLGLVLHVLGIAVHQHVGLPQALEHRGLLAPGMTVPEELAALPDAERQRRLAILMRGAAAVPSAAVPAGSTEALGDVLHLGRGVGVGAHGPRSSQ